MTKKIGFCCKWLDEERQLDGFKPTDPAKLLNTGTTTVRWLKENRNIAEDKIWHLIEANINSIEKLVSRVAKLPESQRMVRIGSDVLPVYTEPNFGYMYHRQDVQDYCAKNFARVGDIARKHNIKLSFHPGQFCVLASDNPDIVDRSIEEFEYHVDMARWMGYGSSWHDNGFKINVHIAGRNGPQGIIDVLPRLSPEARNLITIENEEMKWGLEDVLKLEKHVALVLDVHHHWVKTGEYIQANDSRVQRIADSWRGVRPTMHYSMPKHEYVKDFIVNGMPDYNAAIAAGVKRGTLRAHSDFYWSKEANQWVGEFLPMFDIQSEAKAKNLASQALASELSSVL